MPLHKQLLLFPPTRPLAERLGAEFFRTVPSQPGVYLMSTARDGILYVGKAKDLRRRLGSYRSGTAERLSRKLVRLLLRVERIDWDICPDEASAIVRERDLIRALQPRFNTMGVRPPKAWWIGWRQDGGSLTLALRHTQGRPLGESLEDWPEVRGPFVFAQPVFAALLRTLWMELHPGVSMADLPSRLLKSNGPSRWSVAWNEAVADWLRRLDQFLAGKAVIWKNNLARTIRPLPVIRFGDVESGPYCRPLCPRRLFGWPGAWERLGLRSPRAPTFDEQWRAQDAECLAEFQMRLSQ